MICFLGLHKWRIIGIDRVEWPPKTKVPWRAIYQCTICKKKKDEPSIANQIDFRSK